MRRLSLEVLDKVLAVTMKEWPDLGESVKPIVAVDATGLASGAISTFFVKRAKGRGNGFEWRHQCHTRQVWQSFRAHSRCARPNAQALPVAQVRAAGADRKCHVRRQTQVSARAPGRSTETQRLQALLLGLAYNLYRL